ASRARGVWRLAPARVWGWLLGNRIDGVLTCPPLRRVSRPRGEPWRRVSGRRIVTSSDVTGPPKPPVMTRIMTPLLIPFLLLRGMVAAQAPSDQRLDRFKTEVARAIDAKATFAQQMVDQVFSFGELGMQEVETSKYLSAILERNGFALERGVAGIPTAWVARWGSGKPVIALGSDIDCIPQASQ